jgi:hypothetical protein
LYLDEMVDDVRRQLLRVDGVLVWVDPAADAGDRSRLDPLLRELAGRGIWVSAHPDTILRMGTKEVLVDTKSCRGARTAIVIGPGTSCARELLRGSPKVAPRVLKQHRGNGGIGVYRVALAQPSSGVPGDDALVHTQHARFGSEPKDMPLSDFIARMAKHFEAACR